MEVAGTADLRAHAVLPLALRVIGRPARPGAAPGRRDAAGLAARGRAADRRRPRRRLRAQRTRSGSWTPGGRAGCARSSSRALGRGGVDRLLADHPARQPAEQPRRPPRLGLPGRVVRLRAQGPAERARAQGQGPLRDARTAAAASCASAAGTCCARRCARRWRCPRASSTATTRSARRRARRATRTCYDAVRFRPVGGATQPLIPWINRPTYQQVNEIQSCRADACAALERGARQNARVPWAETASETFVARHDERDAPDAERVLAQLEYARERLERQLEVALGELAVVLHGSPAQLDAAQPWLPLQRRLTAPAARRYVVGWAGERELHVLSPRLLAQRASNVEGSLEMLMLAPSAPAGAPRDRAAPPGLPAAARPAAAAALDARGVVRRGRRAVAVAARRATSARRSRGGCARAASPPSRPAPPTRCCSAARCSTCSPARRASARPSRPPAAGADRPARRRLPRPRRAPHRGRLALAPDPDRRRHRGADPPPHVGAPPDRFPRSVRHPRAPGAHTWSGCPRRRRIREAILQATEAAGAARSRGSP